MVFIFFAREDFRLLEAVTDDKPVSSELLMGLRAPGKGVEVTTPSWCIWVEEEAENALVEDACEILSCERLNGVPTWKLMHVNTQLCNEFTHM